MTGQTISHYKILEKLGEGGMGVVYKAQDTKLDRTVALKFLSSQSISDQDRARFIREAQAAASLSHPNIATVYEIDEREEQTFIAMEYVEGKSLRETIERGPLKLKDAINIAGEIAHGLQAAHEKGIVHRDMKSANVMLTEKGQVKVMDFGLAKLAKGSLLITKQGTTLGTVAYMSPEQAQGEHVDHRTDIWSLGIVLYEMITGTLPFKGDFEQSTLYSILNDDHEPVTSVRVNIPLDVDRVISKMLAKKPEHRYQHVEEIPVDLRTIQIDTSRSHTVQRQALTVQPQRNWMQRFLPWSMAIGSTIIAGMSLFFLLKHGETSFVLPLRFEISLPPGVEISDRHRPVLAISPDGKTVVFVGDQGSTTHLYLRSLDDFETKELPETQGAELPFFSPDGKYIGFRLNKTLKKYSIAANVSETICSIPTMVVGATWGNNDSIIVTEWPERISSVSASGGIPRPLSVSKGKLIGDLYLPEWLPEYKAMIFTLQRTERSLDLVLYDPTRHEMRRLVEGGFNGHYVDGYVIFARQKGVFAAPFDMRSLTITGEEITLTAGVAMYPSYPAAHFAVGSHTPFFYVPSDRPPEFNKRSFAWVDRSGTITDVRFPQGGYFDISLSPDGKRYAFHEDERIWIAAVDREMKVRLTNDETREWAPVWMPDGKRIIYSSAKDTGAFALVIRNVDGSAPDVLKHGIQGWPNSVSRDGRFLAYTELNDKTGADIMILSLVGKRKIERFLVTPYEELNPIFSPDGHWIAYQSNESGAYEIYVARFPASEDKILISDEGGREPRWSHGGRELCYRNGRKTMAVAVDAKRGFHASKPKMLFEGDFPRPGSAANYDVSPDGMRFLMLKGQMTKPAKKINVIVNWQEELKQKMEKKK